MFLKKEKIPHYNEKIVYISEYVYRDSCSELPRITIHPIYISSLHNCNDHSRAVNREGSCDDGPCPAA